MEESGGYPARLRLSGVLSKHRVSLIRPVVLMTLLSSLNYSCVRGNTLLLLLDILPAIENHPR